MFILFFLVIDSYFLINAVNTEIPIVTTEFTLPTGTPIKEALI